MRTLTKKRAPKRAAKQTKLPVSLQPLGMTIKISAQPECVVANCFTDKVFFYRGCDLDSRELLTKTLPASGEVVVTGYEITQVITEAKMAKVGGRFSNFLQIEDLILRMEAGENIGLITTGFPNIFLFGFGVSVFELHAFRFASWNVHLGRFNPRREWKTGSRFFFLKT